MIKAQLAQTIKYPDTLVQNEMYWAEEKVDGKRAFLQVNNGQLTAYNRKGEQLSIKNQLLTKLFNTGFYGIWLFDGEYLNNHYYVFDLLCIRSDDATTTSFDLRREMLEKEFQSIHSTAISLLPIARTAEEKQWLLNKTAQENREGVVFKHRGDTYLAGKTAGRWYKYKHYNALDAFVTEIKRKEKDQAVSLGLLNKSGEQVDVGGCKIPIWHVDDIKVGDVLEVRYLYATENNHLYIPLFDKIRRDKRPKECYTSQLQYPTKQVMKEFK